jgi:hypothetical protein
MVKEDQIANDVARDFLGVGFVDVNPAAIG